MARLDEKTQHARRERILNAAEQCFARQGFHRTSMQDICREAGVSAGAFYVYFASKEALISGIVEREMGELNTRLGNVAASADFMAGLRALGETYTLHQPLEKLRLQVEIKAEALRNPAVAEIVRGIDAFVLQSFERLIVQARDEGRINPSLDTAVISRVMKLIGDGICWQRAMNLDFDPNAILPVLITMIGPMINPVAHATNTTPEREPKMKSAKKRAARTIGAVALAMLALVGYADLPASAADAALTQAATDGPAIGVATARRTAFVETILVTGSLTARHEVLVSPQIEGLRIIEVLAEEGDRVKAGQVLARLDHSTLDAQLAQFQAALARTDAAIAQAKSRIIETEATLKQVEAAFERAKDLVKNGTTSKATFDEREAAARTAAAALASAKDGLVLAHAERAQVEAQIRELNLKLGFTEIKTTVDGIISRRTAKVGSVASGASVTEALFRIVEDGQIELDAEVPEIYLPRLNAGLGARVEVAGLKPRQGTIRLISSEVDRATRLGKVRVFIGDDAELRVGTFAQGLIDTARRDGLGVPSTAVQYNDKGKAVQVVKAGRVETRMVTTGMVAGGKTEILDGLAEGEQVVLRSGTLLRNGDAVRAVVSDNTLSEDK